MLTGLRFALAVPAVAIIGACALLYTPDASRAALEAKYAPPPSVFMQVSGVRLHVRDTGPKTAPAVIFLHGFGSSLQTWDDWAKDLEPDHRVIRFDLPGFGLTGPDPSGDYSDARKHRRQFHGRTHRLDIRSAPSRANGETCPDLSGRVRQSRLRLWRLP